MCSVLQNFKTNREDKGAGEDLGLQRFEWFTSCFSDHVQERGLPSGDSANFDSYENVSSPGCVFGGGCQIQ